MSAAADIGGDAWAPSNRWARALPTFRCQDTLAAATCLLILSEPGCADRILRHLVRIALGSSARPVIQRHALRLGPTGASPRTIFSAGSNPGSGWKH